MDSLTQIVLGAAVGEATLGRKIGNRAMVWGGIAGTLPDLDVLANAVSDPMSALAYHRAFTHSLLFAFLAAPIIGYAVYRMHAGPAGGKSKIYLLAVLAFWLLLLGGSYAMSIEVYNIPSITALITLVFATLCAVAGWWSSRRPQSEVSFGHWTLLFFLAIVTHPLLDCFTAYGTQLFEPFAANRLAWNTISVVDPLYTLPFLLLLILAARSGRGTQVRRHLNTAGLIVSSAYLLLTIVNHFNVGAVLEQSLQEEQLVAERSLHSPSIGNNLLWSATVQSDEDTYYLGQYSLLDEQRRFGPFLRVEGRHDLLAPYAGNREVEILKWFTKGYYTVVPADSGRVQLSDLRYGLLGDDPDDPGAFIFSWTVDTTKRPVQVLRQQEGPKGDRGKMLEDLWERLKGI